MNSKNLVTLADTLDPFTTAYLKCALWSSCDEDGEPLDANYTADDIAPDTLDKIIADCASFQEAQASLLAQSGQDYEQAGHDFWLTRNGHGAGFWDRGLGAVGLALSDACKPYGSVNLVVCDDGKIYV